MCGCDDEKDAQPGNSKPDSTIPAAIPDPRNPASDSDRVAHKPLEFDVNGLTRGG
jgi:hypothetical protein